jgi:hypothetical protein
LIALVNDSRAVVALRESDANSREQIEGLRIQFQDLEDIVLREVFKDPTLSEEPEMTSKKKNKSAKAASTKKGDVLSRRTRHALKSSSDGETSEEEPPSSE